jgi:hypothetical protein
MVWLKNPLQRVSNLLLDATLTNLNRSASYIVWILQTNFVSISHRQTQSSMCMHVQQALGESLFFHHKKSISWIIENDIDIP